MKALRGVAARQNLEGFPERPSLFNDVIVGVVFITLKYISFSIAMLLKVFEIIQPITLLRGDYSSNT